MNYITDFYKLILLILCLLILYITIQNFNLELFQTVQTEQTEQVFLNKKPETVEFSINKLNNNLELNWNNNLRDVIDKYIIIIYIDNQGPYLKIIDGETNERYFSYVYNNIVNNTIYKLGVIAVSPTGEMSDLNIKEFKSNYEGSMDKLSHRFNSKIICDASGQHRISDKCQNDKHDIIATDQLSNEQPYYFNEDQHKELMDSLNKKTRFNFKI